jgi:hypothetical protein
MTKKEKAVQIALGTYLSIKWEEYLKTYIKYTRRWHKSINLYAEEDIRATQIEANKILTEGRLLFAYVVIEVYGKNVSVKWWGETHCVLGNGKVFK